MYKRSIETDRIVDEIFANRQSTRNFSAREVDQETLAELLSSAVYAPYAAISGTTIKDGRRLFVIGRGSKTMTAIKSIIQKETARRARMIGFATTLNPVMRKKAIHFARYLKNFSEKGFPTLEEAPILIILAEKQGFPPSNNLALAQTQALMWIKATSLGLGFQLLSVIEILSGNREIKDMLGLNDGKWAIGGIVIGYPEKETRVRDKISYQEITRIME
jgi:nitroreductase